LYEANKNGIHIHRTSTRHKRPREKYKCLKNGYFGVIKGHQYWHVISYFAPVMPIYMIFHHVGAGSKNFFRASLAITRNKEEIKKYTSRNQRETAMAA
jgi:hypothetical protein